MPAERTERDLLAEISAKLDRLMGVIAIQGKDQATQVNTLYALGFDSKTIGALVSLSDSAVRSRKFRRKKVKKAKPK